MKKTGFVGRLLSVVFGIILALMISLYNSLSMTDTFCREDLIRALFSDSGVFSYESSLSIIEIENSGVREQLKGKGITDEQLEEISQSQQVKNIYEEMTAAFVQSFCRQSVQYGTYDKVMTMCRNKLADLNVAGLSEQQKQAVSEAYGDVTGQIVERVVSTFESMGRYLPQGVSFFLAGRVIILAVAGLMLWLMSLCLKDRGEWLRTCGLIMAIVSLPFLFSTLKTIFYAGKLTGTDELSTVLRGINYLPLAFRSLLAPVTGIIMVVMGIKLKRAQTLPEFATVPVVLEDYSDDEL